MYKKRIITTAVLVLLIAALLAGCADSAASLTKALRRVAVPLKTVKAGNGFRDMSKLEGILKDKKIVAIGEATHGTSEFFSMKHRMFEFLVEKMGYRVFVMEGGFGDCKAVNDYILNGKGSALAAVSKLRYSVWSTREVVDMVEWMKKYNDNPGHKTKIKFYGFDMQSSDGCKSEFLRYISKYDSENGAKYREVLEKFRDGQFYADQMGNVEQLKSEVNGLLKAFEDSRDKYIALSSEADYEMQLQNLRVVSQFIELWSKTNGFNFELVALDPKVMDFRDKSMAENVKWILEYEKRFGNDKIMLWAHNAHVAKSDGSENFTPMGENLYRYFGDKYYAIGFDFYEGSFRASDADSGQMKAFTLKPPGEKAFSYIFEKTGIPIFFFDMKKAADNPRLNEYLSVSHKIHYVGEGYRASSNVYNSMGSQNIMKSYDGLIFIRNTTAAKGL